MKLYSFKIYDNGALSKAFIPCYRKADGEIGLYEIIENKFYANKGEGKFLKGNDTFIDSESQLELPINHTLYAKVIRLGDINCDGSIRIDDIRLLLQSYISNEGSNWSDEELKTRDMDFNGAIDINDIRLLIQVFINES